MSRRSRIEIDSMQRGTESHDRLPAHRATVLPGYIASRQADMIEALLPLPRSAVSYREPRRPLLARLAEAAADGIVAYKGVLVTPLATAAVQGAATLTHYAPHHAIVGAASLALSALFGAGAGIASLAHITNETPPHQIASERAGHAGKIIATAFGFFVLALDYGIATLAGPLNGASWGAAVLATLGFGGALASWIHEDRIEDYARQTHRIGEVAELTLAARTVQPTPPIPPLDGLAAHPVGQQVLYALAVHGFPGAVVDGMPTVLDADRWTVTVSAPGVAARRIIAKVDDLAATLQVVRGGLRITRGASEHQTVWTVDNRDLTEIGPAAAHPITELEPSATLSIWDGVHIADNESGEPVILRLAGRAGIFMAGAPGSGKSTAVAAVTCTVVAAQDTELWTIDGAGRELAMFDPVARFSSRFKMDEAIDLLLLLQAEMIRRSEFLADLGVTEFTREIAHEHGVKAIFYVIGELSHYTANNTEPKAKAKFNSLLADITPRGRANAMVAVLDSQKPEDRLIPSAIRDQIPLKLALKCETAEQVDTILGRGMSKQYPAHELPLAEDGMSLGFGYLSGVPGRAPFRVRTRWIPAEDRRAIIQARAGEPTDAPPDGPGGGGNRFGVSAAGWRGTHLRPLPTATYPDGRRVEDERVELWNALDGFADGFTRNEVGALGVLKGRSGIQRPFDDWARAGYLVQIGVRTGGPGVSPTVWRKVTEDEYRGAAS